MVNQQITNDIDADCFLETNSNRMCIITPTTKEHSNEDTIVTSVTVDPNEEGIRQVRCVSICLRRERNHVRGHLYEDPQRGTDMAYN